MKDTETVESCAYVFKAFGNQICGHNREWHNLPPGIEPGKTGVFAEMHHSFQPKQADQTEATDYTLSHRLRADCTALRTLPDEWRDSRTVKAVMQDLAEAAEALDAKDREIERLSAMDEAALESAAVQASDSTIKSLLRKIDQRKALEAFIERCK